MLYLKPTKPVYRRGLLSNQLEFNSVTGTLIFTPLIMGCEVIRWCLLWVQDA